VLCIIAEGRRGSDFIKSLVMKEIEVNYKYPIIPSQNRIEVNVAAPKKLDQYFKFHVKVVSCLYSVNTSFISVT
jgi:hypothetical protein